MQAPVQASLLYWEDATPEACARYRALCPTTPAADYAAANLYMWDEKYPKQLAFLDGRAAARIRSEKQGFYYLFPMGEGDAENFLRLLASEAAASGERLTFFGVTEEELSQLVALWGENLQITETRQWADYLYEAEKLATLSGKKLHAKRNHINAFCAMHTYQVVPITPDSFSVCMDILSQWQKGREEDVKTEQRAIERGFSVWDVLALEGILLYADGVPVAFSVGSRITKDCFCVHFEKALPEYVKAYPLINREFVRVVREKYPEVTYINREDDMGLPNLRAAKLSYGPAKLLEKYEVTLL